MEESLKARLIGAAVLVALAVLLIPELLSGRKEATPAVDEAAGPRGTRTFTIELGQSAGQTVRGPTMSSGAVPSATNPVGTTAPEGSSAGAAAGPGQPDASGTGEPDVRTEPVASPAPAKAASAATVAEPTVAAPPAAGEPARPAEPGPAASASGGWAVQVGAFGSVDAARKLARDLNGAGYRAFVSPTQRGGKTLHRVRVGPESQRAGAEQLVPRLKARGLPATVVQND